MNSIIELAEAFDAMADKAGGGTVSAYWAEAFQCPDASPDLFVAVAALHTKLLKVIHVLNASDMGDRAKGLYIQAANAMQPFVSAHQICSMERRKIAAERQSIDLLFLAGEVYPHEAAPDINPLTLEALDEELEGLIKEVRQSDMPMLLRHAVEAQLRTLLVAVRGYGVLGQEGFAKVYGSAAVGLTQAAQAAPPADEKAQSTYKKVLGVFQKVGTAVVWASATLGGVHGALESGTAIGGLIGLVPSDGADVTDPKAG